ncbi:MULTISPECIES: tetraacyldisaccharide 4'-kinase [Gammaproteobacteria]|uniref:tetraacyldisaccharide 4'-kinase n=1 Tax=Gammaproteobacteria TaxID=1236 RepID=UPI000DD0C2A0|nr:MULTISPECIES: tetraacyldisaccharide 4'-kinase [Gammaproteobacteria]RTE86946.1 tetraacyldisaccharide 4'-kinase [Aliidiomarina sp. B3213]TCZ93264.1 tetraacyldisaccharide 4'-kinase [Lysobacter sp. N42]
MSHKIEHWWYEKKLAWQLFPLVPLSFVFSVLAALRRFLFWCKIKRTWKAPVPVVVVGNVTVGGTGKTPTVLSIVELLKQAGLKPGIVSRGYGSEGPYPALVTSASCPSRVGDEPAMLHKLSGVPVAVDPVRKKAAQHLLEQCDVNVIVADDGLQHYALGRDIELSVVDGRREFGNQWLLPAGPMRERVKRLQKVDWVLLNSPSESFSESLESLPAVPMELRSVGWRRVTDDSEIEVPDGETAIVIAGIGHPERFFNTVREQGIQIAETRVYPDHYQYSSQDFYRVSNQFPVLMTEKDAVKVKSFARPHWYYLKVEMAFPETFKEALIARVLETQTKLSEVNSNERSGKPA